MGFWHCRACNYSCEEDKSNAEEAANHFQEKKWIYTELTALEIQEDDDFPKWLCHKCVLLLDQFKDFKTICIQSMEEFRRLAIIKKEDTVEFDSTFAENLQITEDFEIKEVERKRHQKAKCHKDEYLTSQSESTNEDDKPRREPLSRDFKCSFKGCKSKFLDEISRDAHFQTHANGGKICCSICSRPFKTYRTLRRHQIVHVSKESRKNLYTCTICFRNYTNERSLKEHLPSHSGEQHVCEECGTVCASKQKLSGHKKRHILSVPEKCPHCDEMFDTKNKFHWHIRHTHRPKDEAKKQCIVCGKICMKRSLLSHCKAVHTVYTTTENLFGCHLCPLKFKAANGLRVHVKVAHKNERKYSCQLCPKKFSSATLLKNHGYVHSGERPIHCNVCNKGFYHKFALDIHMNIHRRQWIAEGVPDVQLTTYPRNKKKPGASSEFSERFE